MQIGGVVVDGPYSKFDLEWEEIPEWVMVKVDLEGEDVGEIVYFDSYDAAMAAGEKLAAKLGVEFIPEASPAGGFW